MDFEDPNDIDLENPSTLESIFIILISPFVLGYYFIKEKIKKGN